MHDVVVPILALRGASSKREVLVVFVDADGEDAAGAAAQRDGQDFVDQREVLDVFGGIARERAGALEADVVGARARGKLAAPGRAGAEPALKLGDGLDVLIESQLVLARK